jgi:hypothetical protein
MAGRLWRRNAVLLSLDRQGDLPIEIANSQVFGRGFQFSERGYGETTLRHQVLDIAARHHPKELTGSLDDRRNRTVAHSSLLWSDTRAI